MKMSRDDVLYRIELLNNSLSTLHTFAQSIQTNDWYKIPASDFIIIHERIETISNAINEIYKKLDQYE